MSKQTSIYLYWETKAALNDLANQEQTKQRKRVSANDIIAAMLWQLCPDVAERHSVDNPDIVLDGDVDPELMAPAELEPAIG